MNKEMKVELEKIKKAVRALEKGLDSRDAEAVQEAEAQLKQVAKNLRSWAKKYGIKLTRHVEERSKDARRRRKCEGIIDTVINGKLMTCCLIGRDGRNCLYECADAIADPF